MILVTGASGFIGGHLVRRLQSEPTPVRVLRRQAKSQNDATLDVVAGDLLVPASLTKALEGIDTVYHLAGATLVRRLGDYQRVNGGGTANLAQACARMPRPPRVIFLSSLAAAGPAEKPGPVSEYGRSKLAGENHFRDVADRVSTSVVRAPGVIGPGAPQLVRLFKAVRAGLFVIPGRGDPLLSFIHVADLVEALLVAARQGRPLGADPEAGIYPVAMPETMTMSNLVRLAAEVLGRRVRIGRVPGFVAYWASRGIDVINRLRTQPLLLNSDRMREALAGSWTCSGEPAARELGFTYQFGLRQSVEDTIAWYRQQGLLR